MASSAVPRSPRSLADDLRSRTPGQISRLLLLRPDLVNPWPADISQVARRAADDVSALDAMQSLNTTALRVLEVFACLHEGTAAEAVAGLPEEPEAVEAAIDELWSMALLWGGPTNFRIVRAAQQAFGAFPCGLAGVGQPGLDAAQVTDAAADVDPELLQRLVWVDPVHDQPHPLLVTRGEQFTLPRESSLILREGKYLAPVAGPPAHESAETPPGTSLWVPVAGVRYVLSSLQREGLAWHPARGVSRRNLADRAERMSVPTDDLMAWLELAAAAGLIGGAGDRVAATSAAAAWLASPPADMWAALIAAWLDSDRPLRACCPDELGVLTTASTSKTAHHRAHILRVWPTQTAIDAEGLAETVAWQRPRMHRAAEQAPDVFGEATLLGLVEGAVATAALGLLPESLEQAATTLPQAVGDASLIIQPDHTLIAPITLDAGTWELVDAVSHLESWGPVTMHRLDPARLRSAVSGQDPQDLLDRLGQASRTPLPQSVEYAVRDAARAAPVRVVRATVVEAGPQDAQTLSSLGFDKVATNLFTTDLPLDVVQRRLAAAGIATDSPAPAEPAEPLDYPRASPMPDGQSVTRLVAHLLGEQARTDLAPPPLADADPGTMVDVCRRAIADDQRLWLRYTDGSDMRTEFVEPIELRSGRLTAWSLSTGRTVGVALSRIAAYRGVQ